MKMRHQKICLAALLASAAIANCASAAFVNPDNGHTYQFTPVPMSWQDARTYANSTGGYLVSVTTQAESDWLVATFRPLMSPPDYVWIGLTDTAVEGTFVWDSGEPLVWTNWVSGEPNNFNSSPNGEDFVTMTMQNGTGLWFDAPSPTYNGLPYLFYGIVEVPALGAVTSFVLALAGISGRRRR